MQMLLAAVDICRGHRMTCRECLVNELMDLPYCPFYDHLVAHAMAILESELYPPEEGSVFV